MPQDIIFGSSMLPILQLTHTNIMNKLRDFRMEYVIQPEHIVANDNTMGKIIGLYFDAYRIEYSDVTELSIKPYGLAPVRNPKYKDGKFTLC